MRRFFKIVLYGFSVLFLLGLVGAGGAIYAIWHFSQNLPDHRQLADYQPKISTRVHAGDGQVIAEFATEKRSFVPIDAIPLRIKRAFIAAEDQRFYEHQGIDPKALARAMLTNVKNYLDGRRMVGGSTITQQVAKNFLVGNERRLERKAREALIAMRMEKVFTKDQILELYLNEIFLGYGAYGVAAASLNYYDKSMDELTIAEAAYLAALPKAPSNYHPVRYAEAAKARRDWVIERMRIEGFVTPDEAAQATAEPLVATERRDTVPVTAAYFVEEVRRELSQQFGEDELYEGGLSARTTVNPEFQRFADSALRNGLIAYDRNHGWRGPLAQLPKGTNWVEYLDSAEKPVGARDWQMAVVLEVETASVTIGLGADQAGTIPLSELVWARPWMVDQELGPEVTKAADVLALGDVVLVEPMSESEPDDDGNTIPYETGFYGLRQIPDIDGGIIAMDPHTGRVLAMSGGYEFARSEFNRATQAWRQPGSAFKPFVYLAALDNGYTPATVILDAPFVIRQPDGSKWKPTNYSNRFYGPSVMRLGIEKSRNLMTVRLAQAVGIRPVIANATNFGIVDEMPLELAMALGAGETTLMRLATAYAMLANGGKKITPTFIDRVQDRTGKTIYRHDERPCEGCRVAAWNGQLPPLIPDEREVVSDPISTYQIVSMLQGVVRRGTGARANRLGKPLAGKTGTTNESQDTWFMGFSPDLVAGVYVGFDTPRTLGKGQTGSNVALPIWIEFMRSALADKRPTPFRVPEGIRVVLMNTDTGLPAKPGDERNKIVQEAFRRGTEPGLDSGMVFIDGSDDGGHPPTMAVNADGSVTPRIPIGRGEPPKVIKKSTDSGLY
jgi:penicillin-binding protein 1A